MKRGKPLKRTGRLRSVSKKRAKENRQRRSVIEQMAEESGGYCQAGSTIFAYRIKLAAAGKSDSEFQGWTCAGEAHDAHEVVTRARGGSITDPANILLVCRPCHNWIDDHPAAASDIGLIQRNTGPLTPD
jgi:hypothetical protein